MSDVSILDGQSVTQTQFYNTLNSTVQSVEKKFDSSVARIEQRVESQYEKLETKMDSLLEKFDQRYSTLSTELMQTIKEQRQELNSALALRDRQIEELRTEVDRQNSWQDKYGAGLKVLYGAFLAAVTLFGIFYKNL